MTRSVVATEFIPKDRWISMQAQHRKLAHAYTLPARKRKDAGVSHPVEDFLFQYYPFPLALLEKWHPGIGVRLEWDTPLPSAPFSGRCYSVGGGAIFADPDLLTGKRRESLVWTLQLLKATRARLPNFACHGLHEWAMVYRGDDVRHGKVAKLRLPQSEIDDLVESRMIVCSHHDAFRHFAPEARPLNRLSPSLDRREELEQPGCVHANMDLYKWAAKAMPWVGSEVLFACFEQALELRNLDMRASPYDLTEWGYQAIPIETAEGRRLYENEQRRLADKARSLRDSLILQLEKILG